VFHICRLPRDIPQIMSIRAGVTNPVCSWCHDFLTVAVGPTVSTGGRVGGSARAATAEVPGDLVQRAASRGCRSARLSAGRSFLDDERSTA
jgi:hypothetical protein